MAKSNGNGSELTNKPLPDDPELLRAMLDAVNDFVERFRAKFDDDPLYACRGFETLLQDIQGTPQGCQSPQLAVKPEFFATIPYLDVDAVEVRFRDLQAAVSSACSRASGEIKRAPIYLDRADEIRHNESQQHECETKLSKNAHFAHLVQIFLQLRESLAIALTETGPWSRPRSPDEWSTIFQRSWDSIKVYFEDQKIRNKKLSSKLYRVLLADLPSDYRD